MYLPAPKTKKNSGFTLVEVGIVSVLMAVLVAGGLMYAADQLRTSTAQATGTALASLNTAVNAFEAKYSVNLANHTAVPIPGYANVVNPYAPTTTELTELGFLKTSVPGGIYGIAINPTVVNGTPSGMVWAIKPFTDNLGHPSQDLAGAAMISAGGDAAISTLASPSIVAGIDGWSAANPVPNTAAILAMRNGAGSAAYVRLDGSTPMQGSLNLNGNNLTSVNSVAANAVSSGTVTATTANAGTLNSTTLYASQAGITNASITNLSTTNLTSQTLTATAIGNDVFFGTSALYSDGWNTVIRNPGAAYIEDFNGNLRPLVASQLVTTGGNGLQVGSSYYYGDGTNSAIRQNGQLLVQNQAGTGAASIDAARVTAEEYVQINGGAGAGSGCAPNGLIGRDGAGAPLFCINGVWTSPSAQSPAGTMCGSVTINGFNGQPNYPAATQNTCQGYAIWSQGCPPGYVYTSVYAASALWMFTCIKT
jgi:type II secretory pathway pseudopilin PulG